MGKKNDEVQETELPETDPNAWPAWFYGPGGASAIFQSAEDVPDGWEDHPSKVDPEAPIDL